MNTRFTFMPMAATIVTAFFCAQSSCSRLIDTLANLVVRKCRIRIILPAIFSKIRQNKNAELRVKRMPGVISEG